MAPPARFCQGQIMAHSAQMCGARDPIHVRFTLRRQMVIDGSTNDWLTHGSAEPRKMWRRSHRRYRQNQLRAILATGADELRQFAMSHLRVARSRPQPCDCRLKIVY